MVKLGAIVPVEKYWDAAEINWRPVGLMGRSDPYCLGTDGKGRDMQMGFYFTTGSKNHGISLSWGLKILAISLTGSGWVPFTSHGLCHDINGDYLEVLTR